MGLRHTLEILRRRTWSLLACAVLGAASVAGFSAAQSPAYSADARVVLRPATSDGPAARVDLVESEVVAAQAVASIPGATALELLDAVSARPIGIDGLVEITATSDRRSRATVIANTFARASFDELRRVTANPAAAEVVTLAAGAERTEPRFPARGIALGGLAGLLVGLMVAATREVLDERVRSVDEIERVTGLPVLAELHARSRIEEELHAPRGRRQSAFPVERGGTRVASQHRAP